MAPAVRYSVVVPVYNELDSLGELQGELTGVLTALGQPYEIVYVDDGSTDGSGPRLDELAAADARVRVLHLARNSGKSMAYMAAFDEVRGEVVFTLDADLQDDPHELPKMLARLDEGWDLVVGWKLGRLDNEPLKAIPSKVFNGLVTRLWGLHLHDQNCGFRAMRRSAVGALELYGDIYRFIPQILHAKGFRVTEAGVHHRKRKFGVSKYGARRFFTGLLDVLSVRFITAHAQRPLHFFGALALAPALGGGALEAYVLAMKLLGDTFQTHIAAIIIGVLLLVFAFQCVITGLIGEMLTAQQRLRPRLRAEAPRG